MSATKEKPSTTGTQRDRTKSSSSASQSPASNAASESGNDKVAVSSPVITQSNADRGTIRPSRATKDDDSTTEEALSFDQYEKQFRNKALKKDTFSELLTFPADDVKVGEEKRKRRTVEPVVPADLHKDVVHDYVQDCTRFFVKEWRVVKREHYKYSLNSEGKENPEDLPDHEYELDLEGDSEEPADAKKQKDIDYIRPFVDDLKDPDNVKREKKAELAKGRENLFQTYSMEHPQDPIDQRLLGKPMKETLGPQIQVECSELAFDLGMHEPFFGTFALYDVRKKQKISETFHFDLNTPAQLTLLGPHVGTRDAATAARRCIFTTSYTSPDIYLVMVISKCLRGDEEAATAPYLTPSKIKDKDKEKYITEARQYALRMGGYRQSFGYIAMQLYDENQQLKPNPENAFPGVVKYKSDKDIISMIEKAVADSKAKNQKWIPGKCVVKVTKVGSKDKIKGRLNPSLVPVAPFSKDVMEDPSKHDVIREMTDFTSRFPESTSRLLPHIVFENNMFFLPESVNFTRHSVSGVSTRNICAEIKLLDDDSDPNRPGLKALYGTSVDSSLTDKIRTAVFYHNKKPSFADEVKIKLPTYLTPKHHLLVTFYHMQCAIKKAKQNQPVEAVVAQCAIPIYPDSRLMKDGVYHVPVAVRLLPGYLANNNDVEGTKWVDNQKDIFAFRLITHSTIYPQDAVLDNFFKQYQASAGQPEHEGLQVALEELHKVESQFVVEYFPIILDLLFRVMSDGSTATQFKAFNACLAIVDVVFAASYKDCLLESYVHYAFENFVQSANLLSEVLVATWLTQILTQGPTADQSLKYSWFLFGVIYKSMVLKLQDAGMLSDDKRDDRFSREFVRTLTRLVVQLSKKAKELTQQYSLGKFLNNNVAFFLRDLFSLLDRGAVFEMIYRYASELDGAANATDAGSSSIVIVEFKFRFLKIICDYEHYIPLNLPIADDLSSANIIDIKSTYWKKHFLAGLLLDEVSKYMNRNSREARLLALNTLRDVFWKHDHDPRYNKGSQVQGRKERIAQIYFPYILLVIDNFFKPRENFKDDERKTWLVCFMWLLKHTNRTLLQNWWKRDQTPKRKKAFVDILVACATLFEYSGKVQISKRQPIETLRSTVSTAEEVVESPDSEPDVNIGAGMKDSPNGSRSGSVGSDGVPRRKHADQRSKSAGAKRPFSVMMQANSSDRTHNRQNTKEVLENYYKRSGLKSNSPAGSQGDLLSFEVHSTVLSLPAMIRKERNAAREVALTILDVVTDFIYDHKNELIKRENVEADKFEPEKLFEKVWAVFTELLRRQQSRGVMANILDQLLWLVPRFRQPLFRYRTSVTGELTYQVMKHLNSRIFQQRSMAAGAILLLIRQNYEEMKNFSRMKLQSTIAISRVFAGDEILKRGADFLKDSLKQMKTNAQTRLQSQSALKTKHGSLGNEVKELTGRLEQIIDDNLKMEEYSFDPETKADLFHQISQGYLDSPDLRITEMDKLAQMHTRDGNFEECAMVRIAQAILVAEYLRLLNRLDVEAMPANAFAMSVFPNLNGEIRLPKRQELESLEQEICQSRMFTEEGYVFLLKEAVGQLKRQIFFESCVEVYRLLLPLYQHRRNYMKQAECYQDLHILCKNSVAEMQSNQRIFAQYYRVAFFGGGEKLQDLDGRQYVYKELGGTRLADFSQRLQAQFSKKLPAENIHLVSNLTEFDRATIKEGHLYMQLVSVEPYFTPAELAARPTLFERQSNVEKFIYETPFTKGQTKISEKLEEQWKRKTIITTAGAFPCLKKRLIVKDTQVRELSPIENSVELIQKKAQSMQTELNKLPRNTKTLQMELQGTLLLQVNAGPAAIAQEFLGKSTKYETKHVDQLATEFVNFVRLLSEGVTVNSQLIGPEQVVLQRELINGYFRLKALICQLTGTPAEKISESFSPEDGAAPAPAGTTASAGETTDKPDESSKEEAPKK